MSQDTAVDIGGGSSETQPLLDNRHKEPTFVESISAVIKASWINVLLIFIPLGIAAALLDWSKTWVFTINLLAIIPLAKLLAFATEDISLRVGSTVGALLNATFGNAIELIVSIIALTQGQIRVVQANMMGSIISNMLLVMGACFLAGGIYYKEQSFNKTAAQTTASLMALACISLIIPATFDAALDAGDSEVKDEEILNLSHWTAIVLLTVYGFYIFFQLNTHKHLYTEDEEEGGEQEKPQLKLWIAVTMLVGVTCVVALCADYLVGSIEGITEKSGLSKTFIGLILLPVVGNAAEQATAITAAIKDNMNLAIGVAAGSSIQIVLFVTPFLVIVGWIIGQPMTLFFELFETVVLFISVILTNYLIQDGKSNWLEGLLLLSTYVIVGMAFYFYPEELQPGKPDDP